MKGYQLIKDIAYTYNADIGLSYSSPARGVWNIVHIGTLVPESHQIFVCPTSCLRGVVLTTAEIGAMDQMSTITVGEDNILEGDMEEELYLGTKKVIESLPVRPRMMMIFTSCIHHFLAVNYQRVYKILRKEYPDIDFVDCYMDPIMRRTSPPVPNLRRQIYRVLKKTETKKDVVNFIGNIYTLSQYCDLYEHLTKEHVKVRDLTTCRNYDEFLKMAESSVNFTFHKSAAFAGKDMEIRLGQKWMIMRPSYVYDEIDEDMRHACEVLAIPDVDEEEKKRQRDLTEEAVKRVKELVGDTPLSVDDTAVDQPLGLCVYLLEHGFNVESCFIENFTESREVFDHLQALKPDLKIYSAVNWNMRQVERGHEGKIIGIGQKAGYFNDTDYFVNIIESQEMYGYRGIRHLMDLLADAAENPKNMRELVQIKGWGCSCGR